MLVGGSKEVSFANTIIIVFAIERSRAIKNQAILGIKS